MTPGRPRTARRPADDPGLPSAREAADFSRRLRAWFRRHGRDLPWRATRDPYRILVSELMLQQTQVARVLGYYDRFLRRFPTLRAVAESPPARVREAWAGLGYYARARNLHRLAREVTSNGLGGELPRDLDALRALPGVGPYTAGAVASFAYERRAVAIDTNVARVLRRVFAPDVDAGSSAGRRALHAIASAVLPRTGRAAWAHNQALMELGAIICTAAVRYCGACPLADRCARRRRDGKPGGGSIRDGRVAPADRSASARRTGARRRASGEP
jgi:A/G-specific adenine glycosylase